MGLAQRMIDWFRLFAGGSEGAPLYIPEVFAFQKLDTNFRTAWISEVTPNHSRADLLAGIESRHHEPLASFHGMLAPDTRPATAQLMRLGLFLPRVSHGFAAQMHGDGGYLPRTTPEPPAQITGAQDKVQKPGPV